MSIKSIFNLNEQKPYIGFAHGFTCIIGAIILGYLCMMLFSKFMPGDYGVKIIPSIVLTPIMISLFGLWLLFSKSIFSSIIKLFALGAVFIVILEVF